MAWEPLPPSSLQQERSARQIVHAAFGEQQATLQGVLSVDAHALRFVALDPVGQRLFTLTLDDEGSRIEGARVLPEQLSPQRWLADLQFVFWPLPALQAAGERVGLAVSEPVEGTRRIRRGERLIAEIHYAGSDPWRGRYWISNFEFSYALTVDSLPLE